MTCTHPSGKHCWERGCSVLHSEADPYHAPVGSECAECSECHEKNPRRPPPFAEVARSPTQRDWWNLKLAGAFLVDAWDDEGEGRAPSLQRLRDIAATVNAAIEAREGPLRGALRDCLGFLKPLAEGIPPRTMTELAAIGLDASASWQTVSPDAARRLVEHFEKVLTGGAEYVPKSQLDEANATVAKLKAGFEALNPDEHVNGELFEKFLVANGWREPTPAVDDIAPENMVLATPGGNVALRLRQPPGLPIMCTVRDDRESVEVQLEGVSIADLFNVVRDRIGRTGRVPRAIHLHPETMQKIAHDSLALNRYGAGPVRLASAAHLRAADTLELARELRRRGVRLELDAVGVPIATNEVVHGPVGAPPLRRRALEEAWNELHAFMPGEPFIRVPARDGDICMCGRQRAHPLHVAISVGQTVPLAGRVHVLDAGSTLCGQNIAIAPLKPADRWVGLAEDWRTLATCPTCLIAARERSEGRRNVHIAEGGRTFCGRRELRAEERAVSLREYQRHEDSDLVCRRCSDRARGRARVE